MAPNNGHPDVLHIAIVGSGPSGFYAAEALLRSGRNVQIDMIERLPTPFGLVRSGVAPDHPKLKQSTLVFDRISRQEGFNFLGNVMVGRDVSLCELQTTHHAVILACGAHRDRRMGIPGEDLDGSHTATEFVGWYNGNPDFRDRSFDFSQEVAVIIGHGNVAADVCRILAKPVDELRATDIAEHALQALAESRIKKIHVIGRRGPAQAKFTPKELRELGEIKGAVASLEAQECYVGAQCEVELASPTNTFAAKNVELFRCYTANASSAASRTLEFRFCLSPVALHGNGRVEGMTVERNALEGPAFSQVARPTGVREEISCGLVFRSIGYRSGAIEGAPFEPQRGVVPNDRGRVLEGGQHVPGLYVTGWQKRGPSGIIGTNRADSVETVENLLSDFAASSGPPRPGVTGLRDLLEGRDVRIVDIEGWQRIDAAETERGRPRGKPREKFTRIDEMLSVLEFQEPRTIDDFAAGQGQVSRP